MSFNRIMPADLEGKGNLGKPDTPGVSTTEMQRILDEIPREVIVPAVNKLADQLEDANAAAQLGACLPGEPGELPQTTAPTVQDVMQALLQYARNHKAEKNNPHKVTASQVGAYTKEEAQQAINERVYQIGSSDMTKAEYAGSAPGVVKNADNAAYAHAAQDAEHLGGYAPQYYASSGQVKVFAATFLLNAWQKIGSTWSQTVSCAGIKAAYSTSPIWIQKTGVQSTDETLQDALNQLNDGRMETLDGQLKATLYAPPPSCDIQIFMRRADPSGAEDGDSGAAGANIAAEQAVQEMLDDVFGSEE